MTKTERRSVTGPLVTLAREVIGYRAAGAS
jgi:hypothetical protein